VTSAVTPGGGPAWLDAGAVLPAGPAPAGDTTDVLTARSYRHPVLGERVVVRLVPELTGPAEDLAMEFLGFGRTETAAGVGVVRRQAGGFVGWVMLNEPANAHHALAVVKEIERLARLAKSRVGPARDGFTAVGQQLASSVPGFLPAFYEEAARAFLAADSPSYAAAMFGKAREAERAYGLAIDEDRQHAVFLEFALAGALTATALSAYARDLAQRCSPDVAYQRFSRLCMERIVGGLPPYATMHGDLKRLAKAAGLGPEAEEQLITDVRAAASLVRAPQAFWTAYQPALVRLARQDAAVAGWLLSIFPSQCPAGMWLAILEETGATAALTGPAGSVPAQAESPDGPAGWLSRLDRRYERYDRKRVPALLALVEQMAGRLAADKAPVALCRPRDYVDLDLVDLCLTLGVPLADISPSAYFPVGAWLADETGGRRDLAALAAHEQALPCLADAVGSHLAAGQDEATARPDRVHAVVAAPGLRAALHWRLDQIADAVAGKGLPGLSAVLDRVSGVACPEGLAVNPGAVARITGHDLGPVLGRTLRAGLMDEYCWPALETALAGLGLRDQRTDRDGDLVGRATWQSVPQWPALVMRAGGQVAVVGSEVELEHVLRIPAKARDRSFWYADGQLLVCWREDWSGPWKAYWTGADDDEFPLDSPGDWEASDDSAALPSGGRTAGGRVSHAGDRSLHTRGSILTDGRTYWTWIPADTDTERGWHEYDPQTGQLGRRSLPAFLEDGAIDGQLLDPWNCCLLPAPPGVTSSPLGATGGLVGWRSRQTPDGGRSGEGIDGRSFALDAAAWQALEAGGGGLCGVITFPGCDARYGVVVIGVWPLFYYSVCTEDGFEVARYPASGSISGYAAGTAVLAPLEYWHYLTPRDEVGSAALRACSDELAGNLLARAAGQGVDAITALVAELLPQVSDPALARGIAGVVRQAANHERRLAGFRAVLAGQVPAPPGAEAGQPEAAAASAGKPDDDALRDAFAGLMPHCWSRGPSAIVLIEHAGTALTKPDVARPGYGSLSGADRGWLSALRVLRAAMYRVASPATPARHREALAGLLASCADSGLLTTGGRLRLLRMKPESGQQPVKDGDVIQVGTRRLLMLEMQDYDKASWALDWAPDGTFGPVPGFRLLAETAYDIGGVTAEMVTSFLARAREKGPAAWQPGLPAALSQAAGVSLAEATTVLAGLPGKKSWEESAEAGWRASVPVSDEAVGCARRSWNAQGWLTHGRLLGLLLPADPCAAWEAGPQVHTLAAWLTESRGARPPVDDDLIVRAYQANIAVGMTASGLLHGFASPATCRWLTGRVDGISDINVLASVVRGIPWLAGTLPGDHPLRRSLPGALELARGRLADPAARFEVGWLNDDKVENLASAVGMPAAQAAGGTAIGPLFLPGPPRGYSEVWLVPALLDGPADPLLGSLPGLLGAFNDRPVALMRALLSEQLSVWASYRAPGHAVGGEHDPLRAVPGLVAEVAGRHGIGGDAAALYLQLLALPNPADRKVAGWTGWKPARLKAARAELAGTDLVVAGKRARAGRSLFLPGGWVARKAPLPPMESWKLPLLIGGLDDAVIAVAPAPLLFEVAWQRVRDGDGPRFDDLVLERGRRR
jgi:hypothetical protein